MHLTRPLIVGYTGLLLVSCALPQHSNTLLFATNTTVALDVSANATTAAPNITIGYKRQEMAWVPLLANKINPPNERQPADCPQAANAGVSDPCVFLGRDGTSVDAYSVLATFAGTAAASGSGGSSSPSSSANGSIAQFFATGLAARTLAEKGGAQLVNTGSAPSADQILAAWTNQLQNDTQKLNAYFNDPAKFSLLRDALVNNSQWKGTPTATALQQQPDVASLMNYAQQNFITHSLATAIPSTSVAVGNPPGGNPPGGNPPGGNPPGGNPPGGNPPGGNPPGGNPPGGNPPGGNPPGGNPPGANPPGGNPPGGNPPGGDNPPGTR